MLEKIKKYSSYIWIVLLSFVVSQAVCSYKRLQSEKDRYIDGLVKQMVADTDSYVKDRVAFESKKKELSDLMAKIDRDNSALRIQQEIKQKELQDIKIKTANQLRDSKVDIAGCLEEHEKKDSYITNMKFQLSTEMEMNLNLAKKGDLLSKDFDLEKSRRERAEKLLNECLSVNKNLVVPGKKKWFSVVAGGAVTKDLKFYPAICFGLKLFSF